MLSKKVNVEFLFQTRLAVALIRQVFPEVFVIASVVKAVDVPDFFKEAPYPATAAIVYYELSATGAALPWKDADTVTNPATSNDVL